MKYSFGLTLLLVIALTGCGGGGGGGSPSASGGENNTNTNTTTSTSTVAQGMITGFGSVVVNGVHFDVKDASIDVDDESHVESDLAVGQVVSITGTVEADGIHGKASKLKSESQLIAPIDSIDLANGIIVAFGQTVLLTGDTFYEDGLTADALKVGDVIRVSGQTNSNGELVASRIDIKKGATPNNLQLTGKVANLNTDAMTFTINGTVVDYSKATLSDLPNKTLANDMLVRVHGSVINGVFVANGNVKISPLDIRHNDNVKHDSNLALSGLIKDTLANTSFSLGDTTILFNANTKFEGGTAANITDGILAKVRGTLDADHNLVATYIKLIYKVKVEDEGLVQSIDLTNNNFTLNGVIFDVTVDTSFRDGSKSKVRLFSLKDLAVGDVLNVRGYKMLNNTSTHIIATRVERHNPPEKGKPGLRAEVSGVIESVVNGVITVDSHSIQIPDTLRIEGFANVQTFLAAAVGLHVEIKGVIENNVFIARSIEISNDDDDDHHQSHSSKSSTHSETHSSSSKASNNSSSASSSSKSSSSSSIASADAVRGKDLYDGASMNCLGCHGEKGATVSINKSKTLESLATYISANMPPSNKGVCNAQCGQDIAAYIKTW